VSGPTHTAAHPTPFPGNRSAESLLTARGRKETKPDSTWPERVQLGTPTRAGAGTEHPRSDRRHRTRGADLPWMATAARNRALLSVASQRPVTMRCLRPHPVPVVDHRRLQGRDRPRFESRGQVPVNACEVTLARAICKSTAFAAASRHLQACQLPFQWGSTSGSEAALGPLATVASPQPTGQPAAGHRLSGKMNRHSELPR